MDEPENIEFFNLFAVSLFDRLYASFPTPINVNARDVAAVLLANEPDDATWHNKQQAAGHAVAFLARENFITHRDARPDRGQFLGVCLTAKGLAVLNATPGSLDKSEPLINKVRAAVAGGAKEIGKEALRKLMQSILVAGMRVVVC